MRYLVTFFLAELTADSYFVTILQLVSLAVEDTNVPGRTKPTKSAKPDLHGTPEPQK